MAADRLVDRAVGRRRLSGTAYPPFRLVERRYYARVPEIVGDANAEKAGWIEFGQPSEEFHWSWQPLLRAIRPEPGLLVLYPSYFFHRTIAYDTDDTRISVAFDVLPVR